VKWFGWHSQTETDRPLAEGRQVGGEKNPLRYFNSSPEMIRLVAMMCERYPLSLRDMEDLLAARGIDICHETLRFWWSRFGPMFAAEKRHCAEAQIGEGTIHEDVSRNPDGRRLRTVRYLSMHRSHLDV
jgi:hypothetical protein